MNLSENISNFDHLLYTVTYPDFATFIATPVISTVISEDRTGAIGEFKQLKTLSKIFNRKIL